MSQNQGDFNAFDAFRRLYKKLEALKSEMNAYESASRSIQSSFLTRAFNSFLLPMLSVAVFLLGMLILFFTLKMSLSDLSLQLHADPETAEKLRIVIFAGGSIATLVLLLVSFLMWRLYASYKRLRKGQTAIDTARSKTTDRIQELERLIKQLLDNRSFFDRPGPEPPAGR